VDVSHQIKAGNIPQAAWLIQESHKFFPKGTIHLAVVDPGVGSDRRPIVIRTEDHFFVGPDNGLFWPIISAHRKATVIHLREKEFFLPRISPTFHGRDIFAPVAAHLSRGIDPLKMGTPITDPVLLHLPPVKQNGNILSGQIVRIDNFGNLITNIHREDLLRFSGTGKMVIQAGQLAIEGMRETYSEATAGEALALIGSSEFLEIAINQGQASERLGVDPEKVPGLKVEIRKMT